MVATDGLFPPAGIAPGIRLEVEYVDGGEGVVDVMLMRTRTAFTNPVILSFNSNNFLQQNVSQKRSVDTCISPPFDFEKNAYHLDVVLRRPNTNVDGPKLEVLRVSAVPCVN